MTVLNNLSRAASGDGAATGEHLHSQPPPAYDEAGIADIIDSHELARRLGISVGTTQGWRKKGSIPFIVIPGSRLIRFSWKSVQEALRRMEREATL